MKWLEFGLQLLGVIQCLIILYQDLKGRWVHLIPVLILLGSGIAWQLVSDEGDGLLDVAVNVGFVTLIVAILWTYYQLTRRANVIDSGLGIGDILVFFALATWFDSPGFLLMFVSGTVIILGFVVIGIGLGYLRKDYLVPLAGMLAGWGCVWWVTWHLWVKNTTAIQWLFFEGIA